MQIYAQAFPWVMLVNSQLIGEGSSYPVQTGFCPTHRIYWGTRQLSITASVAASQGNEGGGVDMDGLSEVRATGDPFAELITPTGGNVFGAGTSTNGEFEANASFGFNAASAAPVHDYRQQHLQMTCGGEIRRTSSGLFTPMAFTSVRHRDDLSEVGFCDFDGFRFPIYGLVQGDASLNVGISVVRIPFG